MNPGRPLIPASLIAMTKGEADALATVKLRDGSVDGTRTEIMVTEVM